MLTKKDAIAVGKAMTTGAVQEVYNCFSRTDETYAIKGAIKGATHRMLQNLWYDVLPEKLKKHLDEIVSSFSIHPTTLLYLNESDK